MFHTDDGRGRKIENLEEFDDAREVRMSFVFELCALKLSEKCIWMRATVRHMRNQGLHVGNRHSCCMEQVRHPPLMTGGLGTVARVRGLRAPRLHPGRCKSTAHLSQRGWQGPAPVRGRLIRLLSIPPCYVVTQHSFACGRKLSFWRPTML